MIHLYDEMNYSFKFSYETLLFIKKSNKINILNYDLGLFILELSFEIKDILFELMLFPL